MTLREAIAMADELRPNALSENIKTQWLNEAEGMVQTNVMLLKDDDLVKYSWEENAETELLAKFPHDKLYWAYLCAMIDYGCGDEDAYQNDMTLFNKRFAEFTRWYANTYRPADGQMEARLYYLTAYAIAVKHGFTGTEEEWLQSLVGPAGYSAHASDHAADGIDPISPASIGALPALGESINDPETNIDELTLTKCYLCGATVISKGLQGNLPFDKSHLLKVEDFTGTGTRAIQTAVLNNAKAPERKWRLWNGTLWSAWQEG